jgi:hypothetical protein
MPWRGTKYKLLMNQRNFLASAQVWIAMNWQPLIYLLTRWNVGYNGKMYSTFHDHINQRRNVECCFTWAVSIWIKHRDGNTNASCVPTPIATDQTSPTCSSLPDTTVQLRFEENLENHPLRSLSPSIRPSARPTGPTWMTYATLRLNFVESFRAWLTLLDTQGFKLPVSNRLTEADEKNMLVRD